MLQLSHLRGEAMRKPEIKITLVDRIGKCGCHRGHKIGDTFDYDTDRGKLCPMAMHVTSAAHSLQVAKLHKPGRLFLLLLAV